MARIEEVKKAQNIGGKLKMKQNIETRTTEVRKPLFL